MSPTIDSWNLLREGSLRHKQQTASDVDVYHMTLTERATKVQAAELWAANGSTPKPQITTKSLNSGVLICDELTFSNNGAHRSRFWTVEVTWKEISSERPQEQSRPQPATDNDPDNWAPSWQRRTQIIFEPANTAYYLSGYSGTADSKLKENWGDDPENPGTPIDPYASRAPLVNSALQLFEDRPDTRRLIQIWSIRWVRTPSGVPSSLLNAEGKINDASFGIFTPRESFQICPAYTLLIASVDLSSVRYGSQDLVEIAVEMIYDPRGWRWEILDQGYNARAFPGDPDENDATYNSSTAPRSGLRPIINDYNNHPIGPTKLDGDGQELGNADPVYGTWSDFQEVDFGTVDLIKDF